MIWNAIELGIFVLFMLFFAALAITSLSLRLENRKIKTALEQSVADRIIIINELNKLVAEIDSKNSPDKDGFLKFVSESREAAFKYIEEVQLAIKEFDEKVGPAVKHYQKTGKMMHRKPSDLIKEVSDAYVKLMSAMPIEDDRRQSNV